jgi:hypothetical protein
MTLFLFVDAHLPVWLRPRPPRTDRATMLGPKDNAIEEPLRVAASEAYPANFTRLRPSGAPRWACHRKRLITPQRDAWGLPAG